MADQCNTCSIFTTKSLVGLKEGMHSSGGKFQFLGIILNKGGLLELASAMNGSYEIRASDLTR